MEWKVEIDKSKAERVAYERYHADDPAGAKGKLDWTEVFPGVEILKSGKAEEREA